MTDSDKRLTIVLAGLLAGLIAGLLSIVVPPFVHQLDSPFIGALFRSFFSTGAIFGIVLCVYFWGFPRRRPVFGSIGFVLASTAAYILAFQATWGAAMFIPFGRHMETDPIAGAPVLAFVWGGTVGAFIVLLAALLFFSTEESVFRNFLQALIWSPAGGALGAIGWATGPSLGVRIVTAMGQKELLSAPGTADTGYYYSIFLVWQAGMGLAIGWLFSREQVEVTVASDVPPVLASKRATLIAKNALFAATALLFVSIARMEFPQQYQSARWQQAYKKHLAERPPMPNQPAENPMAENALNQPAEKPSLENLREVQPVRPEQMMIVHPFGEYAPGYPRQGAIVPPVNLKTQVPEGPAAKIYSLRYALPNASTSRGIAGPTVDVQVQEYPNAAWAEYVIRDRAFSLYSVNPVRLLKFGSGLYGLLKAGTTRQDGFYIWRSENRLVIVQFFFSADPDEILKAYLEKFPSSEKPAAENAQNPIPEAPSLENLREVPLVAPQEMLILHPVGEYVPGDAHSGKSLPPVDVRRPFPKRPAIEFYNATYTIPGAPLFAGRFRPTVEVHVEEYPNAAWAHYQIFQHASGVNLANSTRPIKFGFRIYGEATEAAQGENGFYTWASKNRLIFVSFSSAEPDEILKAYLKKFPPPEKAPLEDQLEAQRGTPEQVLVLRALGDYVPQRPHLSTTVQAPVAKYYSVRYALPGAPPMAGRNNPAVDVQLYEYPTAAWAQYEIFERGGQLDLANPARPVKFGSRIYGQATEATGNAGQNGSYTSGQNGSYIWASGNRLIVMLFYFAEPDDVLKAYLEKFPPSSSTDRP